MNGTTANAYSKNASTGNGNSGTSNSSQAQQKSQVVDKPDGYVVGQPAREQVVNNSTWTDSTDSKDKMPPRSAARLMRPGEWEDSPEPPPEKPKKTEEEKKKEKEEELDRFGRKRERNLADQRGQDWGLRNISRGSVGVTRPIRVDCYADHLVLVSDRGPAYNKQIPFGPRTATAVDPFISAIWEYMDSWGIAGRGMYWKPILQFYVAADAQQRYAEMESLLDGSGLTVVKK
jgi:hypothetical protein